MTLVLAKRGDAAAFLAALASGHPERFGGLSSWATPTLEVTSGGPDRDGARRGDQGHGLAAAVLDPPEPGPRPSSEASHRLLAGRPIARLAEVAAPVVGDRPRYGSPSERSYPTAARGYRRRNGSRL